LDAASVDSARAKLHHVILLLHRAVLHVVSSAREQRKGRLALLRDMLGHLEREHAMPTKTTAGSESFGLGSPVRLPEPV
jgi:hypothetical protein